MPLPFTPSAKQIATVLRRRARLLAVMLLTLVTLPLSVAPAGATAYPGYNGDFNTDGVNIRTSPNLSSTIVGIGYAGHGAYVHDKTGFGDWVDCGNFSTTAWNHVTDNTTGVNGWVSDCYIDTDWPTPTFPM